MKELEPCKKCGGKINNKMPNAIYCMDCSIILGSLGRFLKRGLYSVRQQFPNMKITAKLNIKITKNDPRY